MPGLELDLDEGGFFAVVEVLTLWVERRNERPPGLELLAGDVTSRDRTDLAVRLDLGLDFMG
jgi:hypothetical protein